VAAIWRPLKIGCWRPYAAHSSHNAKTALDIRIRARKTWAQNVSVSLLDGSTVFKRSNDIGLRHAQYCTRSVPRGYKEICTTKIAKVDVECVANLVDVNVIVNVQQLYTIVHCIGVLSA